jgi:hypothetical protein
MPTISLTDFVDFVVGVGPTKLTKLREIKRRMKYRYRFDFWRELREGIIVFHAEGTGDKKYFDRLLDRFDDQKQNTYRPLIANYKSFLGRKIITATPVERSDWKYKQLVVRINPELGLTINKKPYLIKLYFKAMELTKNRTDVILLLMKHALPNVPTVTYGLLDVHHNRLYDAVPQEKLLPLLHGEADNFLTMWNEVLVD